jgi:predicted HAD superfamily Cof-like phosphohydrolase
MIDKIEKELYEVFENFNKSENKLNIEDIEHLVDNIKFVINTNSFINKTEEFMQTFHQEINSKPIEVNDNLASLRLELILEELYELAESCNKNVFTNFTNKLKKVYDKAFKEFNNERQDNKINKLDALLDLQYVLSGAVSTFGFGNVFEEAFEEVHKSNMSKVCKNLEEAILTQEKYNLEGIFTEIKEQQNGTYLIYRNEDKKVLKSIGYKKVELSKFI